MSAAGRSRRSRLLAGNVGAGGMKSVSLRLAGARTCGTGGGSRRAGESGAAATSGNGGGTMGTPPMVLTVAVSAGDGISVGVGAGAGAGEGGIVAGASPAGASGIFGFSLNLACSESAAPETGGGGGASGGGTAELGGEAGLIRGFSRKGAGGTLAAPGLGSSGGGGVAGEGSLLCMGSGFTPGSIGFNRSFGGVDSLIGSAGGGVAGGASADEVSGRTRGFSRSGGGVGSSLIERSQAPSTLPRNQKDSLAV